ncbi:glycoside hydrolase family 16 protein [Schizophyllum amplum]|uniref:Glycoside hydrolase family 16 protein n=1 Tax=Schizophyllum amplum TaxID=97359 RepID=A0A550C8S6_9AGAR|nr:glycoside hydrolase family 16 protein [Auriculariopsis ampla]
MRSLGLVTSCALALGVHAAPSNITRGDLDAATRTTAYAEFLDFFKYDVHPSDNEGVANYVDGPSNGLTYVDGNGKVVVAVETTNTVGSLRKAVRLVSKETFNPSENYLFVFDVERMPAVCGAWPALWLTGSNWPYDGEIDVVEGVNKYTQNVMSVHTGPGCSWSESTMGALSDLTVNEPKVHSCDATADYQSCGGTQKSRTSFGETFNNAGGGVFTLEFLQTGIVMHMWNKAQVPADISAGNPSPAGWGKQTYWIPADQCNPNEHFKNLMLVINTNLGGFFPEGVWGTDYAGGQTTSCKKQTGVNTAKDYVLNHGSEFGANGRWVFNSIKIYRPA